MAVAFCPMTLTEFLALDWIIEILSPDQRIIRVITKIQAFIAEGIRLGWLIDPSEEIVMIFHLDRPLEVSQGDNVLTVLPDVQMTLTAAEIFSWIKS